MFRDPTLFALFTFIITILLESFIYLIWFRKNLGKVLLYALLINAFTWPLASMVFGMGINFILIEVCVFITELLLIKYLFEMKFWKAIILSFIANLLTTIIAIIMLFI